MAEDSGAAFVLKSEGQATVSGVPNLLRQLLFNLLSNALKFSPEDCHVVLSVHSHAAHCEWVIEDEGSGLPTEQLARVFDRFVRYQPTLTLIGGEPSEPKPGHGLSLAICKSIVELHGGNIRAENRTDRSGLRVVVTLPTTP